MLRVTIDGVAHDVDGGPLDPRRGRERIGVDVPAVCHDPRLDAIGCLPHLLVSGRRVAAARSQRARHPSSTAWWSRRHARARGAAGRAGAHARAPSARGAAPELGARHAVPAARAARYGVERARARADHGAASTTSHPYIQRRHEPCISCFRCVRICDEVQGQFTWQVSGARRETHGSCPTRAPRSPRARACRAAPASTPARPARSRTGRVLETGRRGANGRGPCARIAAWAASWRSGPATGTIVTARPVLDAPVNKGHLCVKGRYAHGFVARRRPGHHADDPTTPALGGGLLGRGHRARRERTRAARGCSTGPAGVGVLGSARATNEDNYVDAEVRRASCSEPTTSTAARACATRPSAAALGAMLGTGAATNSFDDIERARTILVCGSNATENHPIVGRAHQAGSLRRREPHRHRPASDRARRVRATCISRVRPGTNVPLLNAIAHVIVDEDLVDEASSPSGSTASTTSGRSSRASPRGGGRRSAASMPTTFAGPLASTPAEKPGDAASTVSA